jgi:type II secretory pathway pseudopilin PulG
MSTAARRRKGNPRPDALRRILRSRRVPAPADETDDGFVLLEAVFAIALMAVIMAGLATFFVTMVKTTNAQRRAQNGVQVADTASENVRALSATAIESGRDSVTVVNQLAAASAEIKGYFNATDTELLTDASAVTGQAAVACPSVLPCTVLPTANVPVQVVAGLNYKTSYYVGDCYQLISDTNTACNMSNSSTPVSVKMYRIVISVTWPDNHCPAYTCSYVTSLLVNPSAEPTFKLNQPTLPPPTVTGPSDQASTRSSATNLQATASGGATPYIWSATGLPTGLAINNAGLITGTATTAGTYNVTLTATDAFNHPGTGTFVWTVNPPATMVSVGAQIGEAGTAENVNAGVASGGTGPFTYTASNLPAGMTINSSGYLVGTPAAVSAPYQTYTGITVTAVDASKVSTTSAAFNYTIYPALAIINPGTQTSEVTAAVTAINMATGAGGRPNATSPTYTWSATGLPPGVTIATTGSSAGTISGTPTTAGTYTTKVTAKDAENVSDSETFTWVVAGAVTLDAVPDQFVSPSTAVDIAFPVTTGTGVGPFTYTQTGLTTSATLTFSASTGHIAGKIPTGTRTVTVTVTDKFGKTDSETVILSDLAITTPATQSTARSTTATPLTVVATGGKTAYAWSIVNQPTGLSINATTGKITGTTSFTKKDFTPTVTVTDAGGRSVSVTFTWKVT